jgi:hypothetical protein
MWVDLKPKSQQQFSSQVSPAGRIVFRAQFPPDAAALGPLLPSNLCCCCCCSVCTLLLPGHKRLSPVRFPFLDRASNKQKRRATRANGNKRRCFGRARICILGLKCRQGNKRRTTPSISRESGGGASERSLTRRTQPQTQCNGLLDRRTHAFSITPRVCPVSSLLTSRSCYLFWCFLPDSLFTSPTFIAAEFLKENASEIEIPFGWATYNIKVRHLRN